MQYNMKCCIEYKLFGSTQEYTDRVSGETKLIYKVSATAINVRCFNKGTKEAPKDLEAEGDIIEEGVDVSDVPFQIFEDLFSNIVVTGNINSQLAFCDNYFSIICFITTMGGSPIMENFKKWIFKFYNYNVKSHFGEYKYDQITRQHVYEIVHWTIRCRAPVDFPRKFMLAFPQNGEDKLTREEAKKYVDELIEEYLTANGLK